MDAMFMAVTKNGSCHVVEAGDEGAVKVDANLRKMPHKTGCSGLQSGYILKIVSMRRDEIDVKFGHLR